MYRSNTAVAILLWRVWRPLKKVKHVHCVRVPLVLDEYIDDEFEAANYKICQWAWCDLHNIGQTRIKTLKSIAPGGILPAHGNTGKKNRSQPHLEAFQNLKERFERLQNTQTTKHATPTSYENEYGFTFTFIF